jgi:hypothetical protein
MIRWSLLCLALVACNGPDGKPETFQVPSRETFTPVGEMLHTRCGSLDCHGQVGRNLRLYGTNGLRLAPGDIPGVDGGRGTEHHKGGGVIVAGGAADRCLTDWLAGKAGATCAEAAIIPLPPGF